MTSRAYVIVVLYLLVALVGQCAGPPDPQPSPVPAAVAVSAAGCDLGAAP
jgi:hypothetical protein